MSEIHCNHCGRKFDDADNFCPACQTPTPAQQDRDVAATKKKFLYILAALAVFCLIMILWLPRHVA